MDIIIHKIGKIPSKLRSLGLVGFIRVIAFKLFPKFLLKEPADSEAVIRDDNKGTFFSGMFASKKSDYSAYLLGQAQRSYSRSDVHSWRRLLIPGRTEIFNITQKCLKDNNLTNMPNTILSIGPRDARELNQVQRKFPKSKVSGVDLFSNDKRITLGDMHDLPFVDNSFNIVFAVHVMEHAYNPKQAFSEISRILCKGGIFSMEVPINFATTEFDRQDYSSADVVKEYLGSNFSTIYEEIEDRSSLQKPNTLRLIFIKD